jgi:hypothetical protein
MNNFAFKITSKTFLILLVSVFCLALIISVFSDNLSISAQTTTPRPGLNINTKTHKQNMQILHNLKLADPLVNSNQSLNPKSNYNILINNQTILVSRQNNLFIETELKNKKINVINTQKGNITFGIPFNNDLDKKIDAVDIVDNKIIYSGTKSSIDIVIEALDGGVRQVINIKDSSAPSFYDFRVGLETGDTFKLTSRGDIFVLKSQLDEQTKQPLIKGVILKPWAKDAKGRVLNTYYSIINNNTLRQTIDLNNASFPVIADPAWCGSILDKVYWKSTNVYGNTWKETVHAVPNWCGKISGNLFLPVNPLISAPNAWFAWQEFLKKTPYNRNWTWSEREYGKSKYWSMYNQFICHYVNPYALLSEKNIWRIDPWRPNVGWFKTYLAACNPN